MATESKAEDTVIYTLIDIYQQLFDGETDHMKEIEEKKDELLNMLKGIENKKLKSSIVGIINDNITKLESVDNQLYDNLKQLIDTINSMLESKSETDKQTLSESDINETTVGILYNLGKETAKLQINVLLGTVHNAVSKLEGIQDAVPQANKLIKKLIDTLVSYGVKIETVNKILDGDRDVSGSLSLPFDVPRDSDETPQGRSGDAQRRGDSRGSDGESQDKRGEASVSIGRETETSLRPKIAVNAQQFSNNVNRNQEAFLKSLQEGVRQLVEDGRAKYTALNPTGLQGGGGITINDVVPNLRKLYMIFNNDFLLKIGAFMSDKKYFDEFIKEIQQSVEKKKEDLRNKMMEIYFFDISNKPEIKKILGDTLNKKITRDTYYYKQLKEDTEKETETETEMILSMVLIDEINTFIKTRNNINLFFINAVTTSEFLEIILNLYGKIILLNIHYKNLITQKDFVNSQYNKFLAEKKSVFSFVKIRYDREEWNPRYKIIETRTDKFLELDYINMDGKVESGTTHDVLKRENSDKVEKYIFGKMDGIYDYNMSNKAIADSMNKIIIKKIIDDKKDFCVIGYGQSGAGKTSTLINLKKTGGTEEKGVLMELVSQEQIINNFNKINVKYFEILRIPREPTTPRETYIPHRSKDDFDIKSNNGNTDNYQIKEKNKEFTWNNTNWVSDSETLPQYVKKLLDDDRKMDPTPNNIVSSRSHVVVSLEMSYEQTGRVSGREVREPRKLIICDLAGVENEFDCASLNEILNFAKAYNTTTLPIRNKEKYNLTGIRTEKTLEDVKDELKNNYIAITTFIDAVIGIIKEKNIERNEIIDKYIKRNNPSETISSYINTIVNNYFNIKKTKNVITEFYSSKTNIDHKSSQSMQDIKPVTKEEALRYRITTVVVEKVRSSESNKANFGKIFTSYGNIKNIYDLNVLNRNNSDIINGITGIINYFNTNYLKYEVIIELEEACKIRKQEGYMINRTLEDLRNDVMTLIRSTIKQGDHLPIFFDNNISEICRNQELELGKNHYQYFYENQRDTNFGGYIFRKIFQEKLEIEADKLNFAVLTVINLNASANNPPKIPYINLNGLYNEMKKKTTTKDYIQKLLTKINGYTFYKNDTKMKEFIRTWESGKVEDKAEELFRLVSSNNASSLIGTLESTDMIQNFVFNEVACHVPTEYEDNHDEKFRSAELGSVILSEEETQGGGYYEKYLKYKNKYLMLKNLELIS